MKSTRLKRVATLAAGGTPQVDDPSLWDDRDGIPWVSIGDITRSPRVSDTDRRVSALGRRSKNLPVGSAGTVLFAMYASVGAIGTLATGATWNQAILGIAPHPTVADSRFIAYWLQHLGPTLSSLFRSNTQDNLNAEQVGNLPFPIVSVDEQRSIADFLDTETARLDRIAAAIARREQLMRARHDAAIIDVAAGHARFHETWHATSDPWIPNAPAHWRVGPLKRWWRVIDCKHRTPEYVATGVPVISPGDVSPGRLDVARAHRFVSEADYHDLADSLRRPRRGDIVYSRNASVGTAAYVDTEAPFTMGQDVCRITSAAQSQHYLAYVLNHVVGAELGAAQIGTTFTRINIARLLDVHVPCPPRNEQDDLAAEMDRLTSHLDDVVRASSRHRLLLEERRQALITAAVTGQFDVTTARGGRS